MWRGTVPFDWLPLVFICYGMMFAFNILASASLKKSDVI
jgi:hypothetical protein